MAYTRTRTPIVFDDGYLSLRELATYSGLSERTLRECLQDPRHPLPHYRIGGKLLVRRSEFDTWAVSYRTAPADSDFADDAARVLRDMHSVK